MIAGHSNSSRAMAMHHAMQQHQQQQHRQSSSVKYRYSCEEMLNYYTRDNCYPPKDLVEHEEVFIDKVQDPLLFTEPSIEELSLLSQSINSECIMKKSGGGKENGEGGGGDISRSADFLRERSDSERETGGISGSGGRSIKLLNSGEGGVLLRKPPGMGGITPSSSNALGNSGGAFAGLNFGSGAGSSESSRGSGGGNPLRPGRGGSNSVSSSERGSGTSSTSTSRGGGGLTGAPRNVSSLFARATSYEESATISSSSTASMTYRSSTSTTSATLITAASKKLGSGSASNSSTSTTGNSAISNSFVPAWRTATSANSGASSTAAATANNSSATTAAAANSSNSSNTTSSESKAEWRSNSDASKNWRIDSLTGGGAGGTAGKTTGKNSSKSTDFFGDLEDASTTTTTNSSSSPWDNQGREYGFPRGVKRGGLNSSSSATSKSKPGGFGGRNSRFDADSNDLFGKTSTKGGAFDDFDSFGGGGGGDDRDLFGKFLFNDFFRYFY